jgi:hypothetical protein
MNNVYTSFKRCTQLFFALVFISHSGNSQLTQGDIAFTGYHATPNSPQSDGFSFVLLKNMSAGTIIHFTDNAWGNDVTFRTGEFTVSFTLGTAQVAGKEITIAGIPAGTASATFIGGGSAGTCTGNMPSLSANGDQVIAYQSSVAGVPPFTFISAIHMNVYNGGPDPSVTNAANWDNLATADQTANSSFIPTGLTTGTNALWIGTEGNTGSERNNARFNCTTATAGGANLLTVAGVRAACNNPAFWDAEFAGSGAAPTWPLPSGCNFIGILTLPVRLTDFTGKLNADKTVDLNWSVVEQKDIISYSIERSLDGFNYYGLGEVAASNFSSDNYSFKDLLPTQGINYYKLRMSMSSGKTTYSAIVKITSRSSGNVILYPNPVSDKLTILQSGQIKYKTAVLSDGRGNTIELLKLTSTQFEVNMKSYPTGIYILKIEDGTVFKVFKQ